MGRFIHSISFGTIQILILLTCTLTSSYGRGLDIAFDDFNRKKYFTFYPYVLRSIPCDSNSRFQIFTAHSSQLKARRSPSHTIARVLCSLALSLPLLPPSPARLVSGISRIMSTVNAWQTLKRSSAADIPSACASHHHRTTNHASVPHDCCRQHQPQHRRG